MTLVNPTNGRWPDFHFHSTQVLSFRADRTYRCAFRAKAWPARTIQPALYQVANGSWNNIGGPPGPFLRQVALARDAGVNLVSFAAPECWSPPDKPVDWSPVDSLCRRIIAVNPKKFAHAKYDLATKLIDFVTGKEGRALIEGFKIEGQQLFFVTPETAGK